MTFYLFESDPDPRILIVILDFDLVKRYQNTENV